jgi:hypothetical protein
MSVVTQSKNGFTVKAYAGDNKTLLAFNFADQSSAKNLAGFSVQCQPQGQKAYYLWNTLQFPDPKAHAQIQGEPPQSSANAPFQKYRWVHVPGSAHQGTDPATGSYTYTVTPRSFDANGRMQPLDASRSIAVNLPVGPFRKNSLSIGFTRGYMQSEAFGRHFGTATPLAPKNRGLQFNTAATAGQNAQGQSCTFADIYAWMGSSARVLVFDMLNDVLSNANLTLSVFAYDLDEPDVVSLLLKLAAQGRLRIILDNAPLHTNAQKTTMEDLFEAAFNQQKTGDSAIKRGHFRRFSHDKVFIVADQGHPVKILTGSTNFSVTGLYCNANHVLVFDDTTMAAHYQDVFDNAWQNNTSTTVFSSSNLATDDFVVKPNGVPAMTITYSPHTATDTARILGEIVTRVGAEDDAAGNVLFAVMQLTGGTNAVYKALNDAHKSSTAFTYGISDSPAGICLYQSGSKQGALVTGKPGHIELPPPFDALPTPPGHEIHDKFVIAGLNGEDPAVWCGSSNLASGGEQANGDNLLQIHDADVASAFAIEALLLVDHYNFLDKFAKAKAAKGTSPGTSPGTSSGSGASGKAPAPAAKKAPAKKAPAKKAPAKKAAARKPAKKAPARPAPKKPAKKAPARPAAKKTVKKPIKRVPAAKKAAKKTPARKPAPAARKQARPAKAKSAVRRTPAKKSAASRSSR